MAPAHRRHGIGSALIDQVEQWLPHNSIENIFSDTDNSSYSESLPAHAHSGYIPIREFTLLKKKMSDQLFNPSNAALENILTAECILLTVLTPLEPRFRYFARKSAATQRQHLVIINIQAEFLTVSALLRHSGVFFVWSESNKNYHGVLESW